MNDITARREEATSMDEMLAAIREAIHAHAAEHCGASGAADVPPAEAGAEEVLLAEEMPAGVSAAGADNMHTPSIPAELACQTQSAFVHSVEMTVDPMDASDDAIEWQAADVAATDSSVHTAEPIGRTKVVTESEQTPLGQEAPFSARVVPLAARRERGSGVAQAHASPPTMGALALQTPAPEPAPVSAATPASAPAPVVRLSAPVRGRVQQALDRLQAREQLQKMRATPQGEAALREILREMLQPLLEEWAREQLPALVSRQLRGELREAVRHEVAAELARLSAVGGGSS